MPGVPAAGSGEIGGYNKSKSEKLHQHLPENIFHKADLQLKSMTPKQLNSSLDSKVINIYLFISFN